MVFWENSPGNCNVQRYQPSVSTELALREKYCVSEAFVHKKKTSQLNTSQIAKAQISHFFCFSCSGGVNILQITGDVLKLGIINNGAI